MPFDELEGPWLGVIAVVVMVERSYTRKLKVLENWFLPAVTDNVTVVPSGGTVEVKKAVMSGRMQEMWVELWIWFETLSTLALPSCRAKLHFERSFPVVMNPDPAMLIKVPPEMGPFVGKYDDKVAASTGPVASSRCRAATPTKTLHHWLQPCIAVMHREKL